MIKANAARKPGPSLPILHARSWAMVTLVAVVAWLGAASHLQAQDYDHYTSLTCEGAIPEELRTAASKKYARELEQLADSAHDDTQAHENFLLQSNFVLDDMLLSGKVLFGDPVTQYITRVKDHILRGDPELQKKVRIYLVKSPIVNAFATNSGILLVNMGLITHLKSEAELAFVLCHEIQHYIHKHPINSYVNAEQIRSNARLLGLNSAEEYIAARTRYSRTLELQADAEGFELYAKSGYPLDAALGVFDLLDYADKPFDQIAWDASPFEWDYMQFPIDFSKWPLDSITLEEEEEDTMSTHPNIAKRRAAISARMPEADQNVGETFIVGAAEFLEARKRCRFELCQLFLSAHAYEDALYNSHLLQVEEPNSRYLKKIVAEALYGLSTYKNARRMSEVHYDPDDLQGEIQQMAYFFDMTDREALCILAVHEIWKAHLADPQDQELADMADAILKQMIHKNHTTAKWLAHEKPATEPQVITDLRTERAAALLARTQAPAENANQEADEKVDEDEHADDDGNADEDGNSAQGDDADTDENDAVAEPTADDERQQDQSKNAFLEWALTDLFANDTFADAWAAAQDLAAQDDDDEIYLSKRAAARQRKKATLKGQALGIDKVVLVEPIYKHVDYRKKIAVQYLASEAALETYKETLAEMCKRNALAYEFLENRDLEEGDVQVFNDASTMLQWFGDYLNGAEDKLPLINLRQQETKDLIARYGTKYFAWNAVVQVTTQTTFSNMQKWMIVGSLVFPIFPYAVYRVLGPNHETLFVTMVFDLETSQVVMEDYHHLRGKASRSAVRSIVYDKMLQISHSR
jgi:beta-barrel assembly-enhancing protease